MCCVIQSVLMRRILLVLCLVIVLLPAGARAQDPVGDLLGRINGLRGSLGLHHYSLNSALNAAAQNHAAWMANTGQVSHTQPDGSTPSTRAVRAGYSSSWVSENIYMGSSATVATAWQFWVNSAIHYRGLTSANNRDIGIAAVSGPAGTAYVLVFGNPGGAAAAPPIRTGGSGASAARSGPPPYVVGVDNFGNIMHEIQPEHTLGHIAFLYGYDWDDLQRIRDLNELTEEEGRMLPIGGILLIPPWDGTYTPTPDDPPEESPPDLLQVTESAPISDMGIIAESTPEPLLTDAPVEAAAAPPGVATSAVMPEWIVETMMAGQEAVVQDSTGVSWTAATVTPNPVEAGTPLAVAALPDEPGEAVAASLAPQTGGGQSRDVPPLLIVAVALQVVLLGIAGAEFIRRSKR
jgi:hypothetical protein